MSLVAFEIIEPPKELKHFMMEPIQICRVSVTCQLMNLFASRHANALNKQLKNVMYLFIRPGRALRLRDLGSLLKRNLFSSNHGELM